MNTISNRAPKRRIERIKAIIIDATVASTVTEIILHTAEDAKTLVRSMGNLFITPIDTAMTAATAINIMLAVNPASVRVGFPTVTQVLDVDVGINEIASWWAEAIMNNANGQYDKTILSWDTKAMRKLKAGDEITLLYDATQASDLRIRGVIYLWFKE